MITLHSQSLSLRKSQSCPRATPVQSLQPHFGFLEMPLCGGGKTVQRKLVLLYGSRPVEKEHARADHTIIEATVLAEKHLCSMFSQEGMSSA